MIRVNVVQRGAKFKLNLMIDEQTQNLLAKDVVVEGTLLAGLKLRPARPHETEKAYSLIYIEANRPTILLLPPKFAGVELHNPTELAELSVTNSTDGTYIELTPINMSQQKIRKPHGHAKKAKAKAIAKADQPAAFSFGERDYREIEAATRNLNLLVKKYKGTPIIKDGQVKVSLTVDI